METVRDRRKYFFYRSDRINFCAEIMHRNFPPPNLCNLRPPLTIMLGRGWLPIAPVEVSRVRSACGRLLTFVLFFKRAF